jgi:hypothetical protein
MKHVRRVVFFLLGDSPASELYVLTFQNTLISSIVIGCVNKNNWDENARVFIQLKVWLKRSLDQSEGGMGRGHIQVEELAVEDNGPKWRPVV